VDSGHCIPACWKLARSEPFAVSELLNEAVILHHLQGVKCVPSLLAVYKLNMQGETSPYDVVVHNILGTALDSLPLSLKMFYPSLIENWARELVQGLKQIHERGVLHRDIKPGNIVWVRESEVYFIDFGLSLSTSWQHDPFSRYWVGTPSFASANVRDGGVHTFADDWESLLLTFAYLQDENSIDWTRERRLDLAITFCVKTDIWSSIPRESLPVCHEHEQSRHTDNYNYNSEENLKRKTDSLAHETKRQKMSVSL